MAIKIFAPLQDCPRHSLSVSRHAFWFSLIAECKRVFRENPFFASLLLFLFLLSPGTGLAENQAPFEQSDAASGVKKNFVIAPVWDGLSQRLARDGISGPAVSALLAQLPAKPTPSPMGRKIRELYRRAFSSQNAPRPWRKYYKGVLTQANAEKCRVFIKQNSRDFENAWEKYGVSPPIAAALLFVETRLGEVLGDVPENAFYTLASMAITTRPADLGSWLAELPNYKNHYGWLEETMRKRADWAYNEFRALVMHMIRDHIPPSRLPGSIYGAVGLCQFMPSNINVYGADGDGDGFVDLFNIPDAIASLSFYLARHGWKRGQSREMEHKLLMTYNHSTTYANTILALADLIRDPRREPPSESPPKKTGRVRHK